MSDASGQPIPAQAAIDPKPSTLVRTTFRTPREMDFFSERELVTQTGHGRHEWPFIIAKELIDNSLDACEEADVAPVIEVTADADGITVRDNGPGLPEATLRAATDFTVRVSNREAYVSPCRGAQGNALKTLLPMPGVVNPEEGRVVVTTNGVRHVIRCKVDPISQKPVITDEATDPKSKKPHPGEDEKPCFFSGTEVRLEWGGTAGSLPLADARRMSQRPRSMEVHGVRGGVPPNCRRLRRVQPAREHQPRLVRPEGVLGRHENRLGEVESRISRPLSTGTSNGTWNG